LFGCLPEIRRADGGPERIVNYDECVIAEDIYRLDPDAPESTPFSVLGDTGNEFVPPGDARCASVLGRPKKQARKLTALAVGCWAYSDTKLIAATRLAHVTPAETGAYDGQVPKSAECGDDFTSCYDPESDVFGTCYHGHCSARCTEDPDCLPQLVADEPLGVAGAAGDPSAGGTGPDDGTKSRCYRQNTKDYVGVCVTPTSSGTGGAGG
jgi:hypothetical protein